MSMALRLPRSKKESMKVRGLFSLSGLGRRVPVFILFYGWHSDGTRLCGAMQQTVRKMSMECPKDSIDILKIKTF